MNFDSVSLANPYNCKQN